MSAPPGPRGVRDFIDGAADELKRGAIALRLFVGAAQIALGTVFVLNEGLWYSQPNYRALREWQVLGYYVTADAWGLLAIFLGITIILSYRRGWPNRWVYPFLSMLFWGALAFAVFVASGLTVNLAFNLLYTLTAGFVFLRSSPSRLALPAPFGRVRSRVP